MNPIHPSAHLPSKTLASPPPYTPLYICRYARLLLWPWSPLSYDYGFDAVPLIHSLTSTSHFMTLSQMYKL